MKKQEVIIYYGSVKRAADALKITVQAVYAWKDPMTFAIQNRIECQSRGNLVADHPKRRKND